MSKRSTKGGEDRQEKLDQLRHQVAYLQAAARELAAQRDALGERAANLAGELAVLKARSVGDSAAPGAAEEDPAGPA